MGVCVLFSPPQRDAAEDLLNGFYVTSRCVYILHTVPGLTDE